MNMPRIMIAAPASGSGKTVITCALLELLRQRDRTPVAFKCGPDYIDPMFHREIIGIPSNNLDTFFADEDQIRELFVKEASGCGISVVEGVMGLYDGLGGVRKEGSAYHLASVLKIPILLVVNARGMGQSLLPLIAGFLQYDTNHLIQGVLLNQTSPSFCQTIAPLIEEELSIPVIGCFPRQKGLQLESRHLGLKLPEEIRGLREQVQSAADVLEKNIDWKKLLEIAGKAEPVEAAAVEKECGSTAPNTVAIAVAKDEAFCFYYTENLRMLEAAGARLVYFSPLHDRELPKGISGILLGGGYPELVAGQLSRNECMRNDIRNAIRRGIPSVAECGGFLYLHEKLITQDGSYPMCGVIPETAADQGKLVRFGYVEITSGHSDFLKQGQMIRGHEFHYYDSTDPGIDCRAQKPLTGKSYECIHSGSNYWWGFPHLYYPSNPEFVTRFVQCARRYQEQKA